MDTFLGFIGTLISIAFWVFILILIGKLLGKLGNSAYERRKQKYINKIIDGAENYQHNLYGNTTNRRSNKLTLSQVQSYVPSDDYYCELFDLATTFPSISEQNRVDIILYCVYRSTYIFSVSIYNMKINQSTKESMLQSVITASANAFYKSVAPFALARKEIDFPRVLSVLSSRFDSYSTIEEGSNQLLLVDNLKRTLAWYLGRGKSISHESEDFMLPVSFERSLLYNEHTTECFNQMSDLLSTIDDTIVTHTYQSNSLFFDSLQPL